MRRKRDIAGAYSTACERVYQYPLGDSRTGVWIGWRDALAWVLNTAIRLPGHAPGEHLCRFDPSRQCDCAPDTCRLNLADGSRLPATPPPSSASGGGVCKGTGLWCRTHQQNIAACVKERNEDAR